MKIPTSTDKGRRRGRIARNRGMSLACRRRQWFNNLDELRFLDATMGRPERTATTDDAVVDLADVFEDGGKRRGSIPAGLARKNLIVQVDPVRSDRPSRHWGYVAVWRAADVEGIERRRGELRKWLAAHPRPEEFPKSFHVTAITCGDHESRGFQSSLFEEAGPA